MTLINHPILLRQLVADRHEAIRRAAGDTRLRRDDRTPRQRRRQPG